MIKPFETEGSASRPLVINFTPDQVLLFVLMVAIVGVRVANLGYNSLFVDEAIYATVGRNALAGVFDSNALAWMYGSYLYPVVVGLLDRATGELGLRLLSALLSSAAACWVYLATARLFGAGAPIWAALCYGLTAISINLGQYAVYDTLAIPALALSLYLVLRAAEAPPATERGLLLTAALVFTLGTLAKYVLALYLPALLCIGAACALRHGRPLRPLAMAFLAPVTLTLGVYALLNRGDLVDLFAGGYGVASGSRATIIADIWAELGAVGLIALAGLAMLVWPGLRTARSAPRKRTATWVVLVLALTVSLFAAPIYHLITANQHAAWKHTVYSLILLAPLAGYACATLVRGLCALPGRRGLVARLIGVTSSVFLVLWGLDYALDRNWGFQHSWPNTRGVVAYLEREGLVADEPVLAEGAAIYAYYLYPEPEHRAMWTSTWYSDYEGLSGAEAMEAAIADRHYRTVILDGYYTPELLVRLEAALARAGYRLGYEETQELSLGFPVTLRVYHAL